MGVGPKPPETLKVTCIRKGEHFAMFAGHETAPDTSDVSLTLVGDPEYFTVGRAYVVVFQPVPPDDSRR